MRRLDKKEVGLRGCPYCTDCVQRHTSGIPRRFCPYDECPYHELDQYKSYRHYLRSTTNILNVLIKPKHGGKNKM